MFNAYQAAFRFHQSKTSIFKLIKNTGVPTVVTATLPARASSHVDMDSEPSTSVCAPKRERKTNFSDEEVKVLLELYQQQ